MEIHIQYNNGSVDQLQCPTCIDTLGSLSPNQLLTLKRKVLLPLPGIFMREDVYCQRHWRRVQYLVNKFWERWKREFLPMLQTRRKWQKPYRYVSVDDIVLLCRSQP